MGSHRGKRRAEPARRTSAAPRAKREKPGKYVGKRVAGRSADVSPITVTPAEPVVSALPAMARAERPAPEVVAEQPIAAQIARHEEAAQVEPTVATQRPLFVTPTPTVELPTLAELTGEHLLPSSPEPSASAGATQPGRRRALKPTGPRRTGFRGVPTLPVAVGVATLAVAVGGTVTSADTSLAGHSEPLLATNAMSGSFGSGTYDALRGANVSRDSDRDALENATDTEVVDEAEKVAAKRDAALTDMGKVAEKVSQKIALNRWGLPIPAGVYHLTATYGEYGLWSSYHTGLDFAAPTGTPIHAVTNGTVTEAGYDGAYGNKTVVTLEDGTELWFCHQTSIGVSVGDVVQTGEVIGYVGSTGHVTGPHLHLEVRPGGGDPVDPDAALRQHGVVP